MSAHLGACATPAARGFDSEARTDRPFLSREPVERNELLAEVFADALAADGIEAAVVTDDEEALAACQPDMPRVVVTGINRRRDDM